MPGGDYRDALRERAGWTPEPGPLLDVDGERVGEHGGTRRLHRRPAAGPRRRARRAALRQPDRPADQHHPARPARGPRDADRRARAGVVRRRRRARARRRSGPSVRIRHRATPVPATVDRAPGEPARGRVDDGPSPVWAAAPGQAAVLYDGDVVLGGGRIAARAGRRGSRREHRRRRSSSASWSGSLTRRCGSPSGAPPAVGCR